MKQYETIAGLFPTIFLISKATSYFPFDSKDKRVILLLLVFCKCSATTLASRSPQIKGFVRDSA